ncbi:transcriptional regulator [Brochothrix thermosphacta]|uniref:helix-turn-helix transcriptional regulator n=1 Tax=Brochothrix thermosphacta TaxID=2756 RepID=UPI000E70CFFC|nr:helix-turn-helix transcriptional regulator [Brochothrix thermosphacta]ANZ94797.1 transcriptional regulator [Brochothrix thermosphacta]
MRKWLIELRKGKCLTQQEVADEIGVSRTAYTMYEQGQRNPAVKTAKKVGEFLYFDWTRFFE